MREWLDELTPIGADTESRHSWFADAPWLLETHRALANARVNRLTRRAHVLASIKPMNGVAIVP